MLKAIIFDFDYTLGASTNDNLDEAEQFTKLFREKADSVMVAGTELYTGVKDVLQKLKAKGYKMAIVTTKFRYRIEHILSKFDAVLTGTTTRDDFRNYNSAYIGENISDVYKYVLTLEKED